MHAQSYPNFVPLRILQLQSPQPQLTPSHSDLPPVKPSAIALGTAYTHLISLAVLAPVFGDTYHRAQAANSKEEFAKSKEAAGAAAAWGSSLAGSALQTYGVGALLVSTGVLSHKGAAYMGTLIFFASAAPSVSFSRLMIVAAMCHSAATCLEF